MINVHYYYQTDQVVLLGHLSSRTLPPFSHDLEKLIGSDRSPAYFSPVWRVLRSMPVESITSWRSKIIVPINLIFACYNERRSSLFRSRVWCTKIETHRYPKKSSLTYFIRIEACRIHGSLIIHCRKKIIKACRISQPVISIMSNFHLLIEDRSSSSTLLYVHRQYTDY